MKKSKPTHTSNPKRSSGDWHVSHSSMGMGDYYGTGVKQKVGKMRSDNVGMRPATAKQVKTPPKSLA